MSSRIKDFLNKAETPLINIRNMYINKLIYSCRVYKSSSQSFHGVTFYPDMPTHKDRRGKRRGDERKRLAVPRERVFPRVLDLVGRPIDRSPIGGEQVALPEVCVYRQWAVGRMCHK